MSTGSAREIRSVPATPLNRTDTPILDYRSSVVRRFTEKIRPADNSDVGFLRAAHGAVATAVRPVYTVRERQPVSRTIFLRRGSCSQRMACLEAAARAVGISTRVRALWVSGHFWSNRFPVMRVFIPRRVLLAWPQFNVEDRWVGVEEIFGAVRERASRATAFANDGETLFEAVQSTVIDFDGRTRECSTGCDLSRFITEDTVALSDGDSSWRQVAIGITTGGDGEFRFIVYDGLRYTARAFVTLPGDPPQRQAQGRTAPFVASESLEPLRIVIPPMAGR